MVFLVRCRFRGNKVNQNVYLLQKKPFQIDRHVAPRLKPLFIIILYMITQNALLPHFVSFNRLASSSRDWTIFVVKSNRPFYHPTTKSRLTLSRMSLPLSPINVVEIVVDFCWYKQKKKLLDELREGLCIKVRGMLRRTFTSIHQLFLGYAAFWSKQHFGQQRVTEQHICFVIC